MATSDEKMDVETEEKDVKEIVCKKISDCLETRDLPDEEHTYEEIPDMETGNPRENDIKTGHSNKSNVLGTRQLHAAVMYIIMAISRPWKTDYEPAVEINKRMTLTPTNRYKCCFWISLVFLMTVCGVVAISIPSVLFKMEDHWNEWTAWTECDATSGFGQKQRVRSCITDMNEAPCHGNRIETKLCFVSPPCQMWGEWTAWTECDATCGLSQKQRVRSCTRDMNGMAHLVNTSETKLCLDRPTCPIWSEWLSWTQCDTTCGLSQKQRARYCIRDMNETLCNGKSSETALCLDVPPCPIWGAWTLWEGCDGTCEGEQARNRVCFWRKEVSGICQGSSRETRKCNCDCQDVYRSGVRGRGVYTIKPKYSSAFQVYCDAGWTVFMKRFDGSLDFDRPWAQYKQGFGKPNHEFWLGNDKIHHLTNQKNYMLKVDYVQAATAMSPEYSYDATYSTFRVENETNKYRLHVSGFTGPNRRNALYGSSDPDLRHNGMFFSTKDRDNDRCSCSCAVRNKGGFWYNSCHSAAPTQKYKNQHTKHCMYWHPFCTSRQVWKIKPNH